MNTKIALFLLILTTATACNQTQNRTEDQITLDTTSVENVTPAPSSALPDYKSFVSKLGTFDVNTATVAAKKYQEVFKDEDLATRDEGFIVFNAYYEKLERNLNELHEKDTTNFDPLIMVDASGQSLPLPQKLKEYNDKLKRNGFEVASSEGMSYIRPDRDFLAKWFYSYVSPTMKQYLEQLNKENKEGFQEDGGLTIDAKQYVNRIIWWENFIKENPGFVLAEQAKENRKYLLTFLLLGMDNSPVLSYEGNSLEEYYQTAYAYLEHTFPQSEIAQIVQPYYQALLQKDKKKATALLDDYKSKGLILDFGTSL